MKEKIIKLLKKILVLCIVLFVLWNAYVLWEGFLSHFIPWTRTFFVSYESYDKFLWNRSNCFANNFFMDELPVDSGNVKYYWHENWGDKLTAYSVTLSDEAYEKIAENRINAYYAEVADRPEKMVYKASGYERLYIEDTDWYDEERLHYINELMINPGAENQYYFATIVQFDKWHIGVLLNDSTKEMIEFHAELRDDAVPHIGRLYWRHNDFLEDTHRTSYCQDMPDSVHDTEYYVFEEDSVYKSGYRAAFSAEDYALVKQERMEYYQTALFDSKYADDYVGERYINSDDPKQYLNSINLEDKRIDYLDVLLTEEKGDFYLGCSRFKDHEEKRPCFRYQYDAVLFNDETHEMIEISYDGPLDMPIDSGEEEASLLDLVAVIFLLLLRLVLPILAEAGVVYLIVSMLQSRKRTRTGNYEKSEPDFYDFMDFPNEK